jgi:acyl transferase domain-containing protein/acyl carrier protein
MHSGEPQEPLAIVGIGCRLPGGVAGVAAYSDFIARRGDGVVEVPAMRYSLERHYNPDPDALGKTYMARAGFLEQDIETFDPAAFGISPREAAALDPQQRLLLEVAWETFEDAGLPVDSLAGSRTGVYIGGFCLDMYTLGTDPANRHLISSHTGFGLTMTVLASRLSYTFDLRGPSLSVDTACSSSLVALHLASRALRMGECDTALVGGVNVMLSPVFSVIMCKGHFLAKDGRSKAFDAAADGYGRGEGAALVLLKPLARAQADGNRIHGVILGTAVNQDGRTDGMAMPSEDAQKALILDALRNAGVDPARVGYVEAHGTGTPAGDPIESRAIGSTYGRGRTVPCRIGSVKTNIGHLEAAAGVAGLIKATLAVRDRRVPPQRALETPSPTIPFGDLGLKVAVDAEPWPLDDRAIAGVNGFGYGGTNAHAIVAEPPPAAASAPASWPAARARVVPVSAATAEALRARAGQLASMLASPGAPALDDLVYTLGRRRTHLPHRAAVVASDLAVLRNGMTSLVDAAPHASVVSGVAPSGGARLVWMFTGMGPQWWAMGRQLIKLEPIVRNEVQAIDERFKALAGWSILKEMLAEEGRSRMRSNEVAQPANFVLQAALVALLRDRGVMPDAIIGHSVGEVAATYASGALSLDDAVMLAVHRARIQQKVAGRGTMLAIGLGEADARALFNDGEDVDVAAINARDAVTLSGARPVLERIAQELAPRNVFARFVPVEVAYHSAHMDELKEEFLTSLAPIRPRAPALPLYSTVTGARVEGVAHDAAYWWANARQPVRLRDALERCLDDGFTAFLEVGPHPVLAPSIRAAMANAGVRGATVHCLKREEPEQVTVAHAIASLFAAGVHLDDERAFPAGKLVDLPLYPWQRERYWTESAASREHRLGRTGAHPLLADDRHGPTPAWTTQLASPALRWIHDHRVAGDVVCPGAAYAEAGLAAAVALHGEDSVVLDNLSFHEALTVGGEMTTLSVEVTPGTGRYTVHSRVNEGEWRSHAQGRIATMHRYSAPAAADIGALRARCREISSPEELYGRFSALGLEYGGSFRSLVSFARNGDEFLAEVDTRPSLGESLAPYVIHPAVLDAGFQALLAVVPEARCAFVPVEIQRICMWRRPGARVFIHGSARLGTRTELRGGFVFLDDSGRVLAEVLGMYGRALTRPELARNELAWLHAQRYEARPAAPAPVDGQRWLVAGEGVHADVLGGVLAERGARVATAPGSASAAAITAALGDGDPTTVVLLPRPASSPIGADVSEGLIDLVRTLRGRSNVARLWIATRFAHLVERGDAVEPAQATLVGLARVMMLEHPELSPHLVDVDALGSREAIVALADTLATSGDREVVIRGTRRLVARLASVPIENANASRRAELARVAATAAPVELMLQKQGLLDSLVWRPMTGRIAPGPTEVEVEIHHVGLNFKDVMKALGQLSRLATDGSHVGKELGMEASGRVVRAGKDVSWLKPGDEVAIGAGGVFRSFVTLDEGLVVKKAKSHSLEQAATYFPFVTAWFGLVTNAQLSRGETVLIHSAAGGVGMAAVQIARMVGAEIFATAGSEEKRALLRSMGIKHVYDSRSLDFADQIRAATGGRGVDVVLNSLAGPALERSLDVLAPCGRFIEMGKQDINANRGLGLRPFNDGLSFIAIDLDRLTAVHPRRSAGIYREVMGAFDRGDLEALPVTVFPADQVVDAFRLLTSGRHTGKVVVSLRAGDLSLAPGLAEPPGIRADRSYLVTGGLRGFGLATASWLADEGAKHLVLVSRSGAREPEALAALASLRNRGVTAKAVALDVSDAAAVCALVAEIESSAAPLAGVFHAAMVLEDKPLVDVDRDALLRVLDPKARGAWNLHEATHKLALDHFVLYSSIAALVGNPTQGSYAAANAFLDALAQLRRASGLAGTSVSWGVLGDVGVATRNAAMTTYLKSLGMQVIPAQRALAVLGALLREGHGHVGVFELDWARWRRFAPADSWTRFEQLMHSTGDQAGSSQLAARLQGLPAAKHLAMVEQVIASSVARVLKFPIERIDAQRPLKELGLDSLIALEIVAIIRDVTGVELTAMQVIAGASVASLAARVLKTLPGRATSPDHA